MQFHEQLKTLRKNLNLTQEELAQKLGVSAAAIGLYEQGRRNPDNDTLIALASIFKVSIDYLLGVDVPTPISHYGADTNNDMTFDDFTYAMFNETKDLTEEQKNALLNMAKTLKNLNK